MSAATAVAAGWLDEHLACAVPLTMCDLDRRARRCGGDYPAHVRRIPAGSRIRGKSQP